MKLKALESITQLLPESETMPLLFLGHGSPMNAIEENEFTLGFQKIAKTISKPTAIICISAHWLTKGTYVTAMIKPKTIHDFGGFPQALYNIQYPAPGHPELASAVSNMINSTNVQPDYDWGLDHGTWSVIKHLYPNADIPIIQISIDYKKPAEYHYKLASELQKLRNKGVLFIGSGNIVHNLSMIDWANVNKVNYGYDWTLEVQDLVNQSILSGNHENLINYTKKGEAFQLAIPTPDHFLPLLYILGMQNKSEKATLFNDKAIAGSLTMTSVKIA